MSVGTGTIAAPGIRRKVWSYWLKALVVAGLLATFAVWALTGRETSPAVENAPDVTVVEAPVEAPKGPPEFRQGPNGEAYPAPRVGR
jgi:hypothetical protein